MRHISENIYASSVCKGVMDPQALALVEQRQRWIDERDEILYYSLNIKGVSAKSYSDM